jgi:hypothetical protein
MPDPADDRFERVVAGIERLQVAYSWERKVFLGCVVVAFLLVVFLSVMTAFGRIKQEDWSALFAPGGLFLGMTTLAMFYFNRSFSLLRDVLEVKRDEK